MRTNESSLDFISKPCSGQCLWQEVHPGPCIKNKEVKCVWIIKVGVERANWFSAVGDSAQWGSMVEWKCTQRWKQARGPRRSTGVPNHPCLVTSIDLWHIAQLGWGRQKMLSHLNSHQTKFQLQYGIHQSPTEIGRIRNFDLSKKQWMVWTWKEMWPLATANHREQF